MRQQGLVDGRLTRPSSVAGRTDPRVVALLEAETTGQEDLSTGTRSRAIGPARRVVRFIRSSSA